MAAPIAGRRLAVSGVAAVIAGTALAAAWLGAQAWQAKDELEAAAPLASEMVSAAAAGDVDTATAALERLRAHADRARDLTDSPLWSAASAVPGLGPNADAVRTVAASLAAVADSDLAPLLPLASTTDRLDLAAVAAAGEPLSQASAAVDAASDALAALDESKLLPPVTEGVIQLRSALLTARPAMRALAQASAVLPGLLGGERPRTILLMLQNNAEPRTGGGITGAFVELRVEGGVPSLTRQAESRQFAARPDAIAAVPEATTALYGDVAGRFVQNATMPADFTVSADLASRWWQSQFGVSPDAVVAIDPLVLRALLAVSGPVALEDGSAIDAGNVVTRLFVDPYRDLDPEAQTAYLQRVTAAVFSSLTQRIDPVGWAGALAPVVAEGRVSIWSADPAEQAVLATSAVGGPRARLDAAGPDAYAVYLNDATGGKMGPSLDVSIEAGSCPGGDVIRVTLANSLPVSEVAALPPSVSGGGIWGTGIGDIGTNVTVASPAGAGFGGASEGGSPVLSADAVDGGRAFTAVRVNVSPGESETVEFRFVRPGAGSPVVVHTPLITEVPVSVDAGCRR